MIEAFQPLFPAGIPGGPELLVILLLAVLLFGANKIPKLARSTGQAMGEFQKGRQQVEQELEQMQEGELDPEDLDSDVDADTTVETADADTTSTADAETVSEDSS